MIEAILHPTEHVFDPLLGLSAEEQAERWLLGRLITAGFVFEFCWLGEGAPRLAGRWERETLPGGGVRFRQWPNELPNGWLSTEIAGIDAEIAAWPDGLRDSLEAACGKR